MSLQLSASYVYDLLISTGVALMASYVQKQRALPGFLNVYVIVLVIVLVSVFPNQSCLIDLFLPLNNRWWIVC